MKWILTIANKTPVIVLSSLFGAAAISYINATLLEVCGWLVPVVCIVLADLGAGIRAAKARGEKVRFSTAARRTFNKLFCYACWIFTCVALNERYETRFVTFVGMGIVFLIEGLSFLTNVLEPHGLKISIPSLLKLIGKKVNVEGLEDVIEKKDNE